MNLKDLQVGTTYVFHTKPFETPFQEVLPGEAKTRTYLGEIDRAPAGQPPAMFAKVARPDGTTHLIFVDHIERVEAFWSEKIQ